MYLLTADAEVRCSHGGEARPIDRQVNSRVKIGGRPTILTTHDYKIIDFAGSYSHWSGKTTTRVKSQGHSFATDESIFVESKKIRSIRPEILRPIGDLSRLPPEGHEHPGRERPLVGHHPLGWPRPPFLDPSLYETVTVSDEATVMRTQQRVKAL